MGGDMRNEHGDGAPGESLTRRRFLKAGLGTVAMAAASPLLTACGGSSGGGSGGGGSGGGTLATLRANGARIGIAEGPPLSILKDGKAAGVYPEIAEMVLQKLGVTKFIPVLSEFSGVIPGVQAGRADLGCPGLYITPERCQAVLFTNPEVSFFEAMAVRKGNPLKIRTYKDVKNSGARLGVVNGSFEVKLATKEGVSASNMQDFPDMPSMLDAIIAGRIDAGGYDNVTIGYFLTLDQYKSLDETTPYLPAGKNSAGIGLKKDATDLQAAFNKEQTKLYEQNAFASIYTKWGVPQQSVNLAKSQTWQEFCKA